MPVREDQTRGGPDDGASRVVQSRPELDAFFGGVADGVTAQDAEGRLVYANDAAARLIGFDTADALLAAPLAQVLERFDVLDEERQPFPLERLPGRAALRGELGAAETLCYRIKATGEERWSLVRATPVHDSEGRLTLAINTFHDLTDQVRANERLRFLVESSSLLSSSLDFDETLARLGDLIVPAVADYCVIDLIQEQGPLRQAVLHHVDPAREEILRTIRRRYPPDGNPQHPASRVLATGEPLLLAEVEEALVDAARDSEHLLLYRQLEPSSYLVVPLVHRGRTIGTLSLGTGESRRRFAPDDVTFAVELANRIAPNVENARLHTEVGESLALVDTLLVSSPVAIGFWDRELRFVRANDALAAINGLAPDDHVGRSLAEVVPGLAAQLEPLYRRVLESGEPIVHEESTDAAVTAPGAERHWLSSYYPVRTGSGATIGVGAVIVEMTEQRRAEERLRLLAEAGTILAASLDHEEILERIMRIVVPRLGDSAHIFLAEGKRLRRAACAHVDPELQPVVESMPDSYELGPDSPAFMATVYDRGEPLLFSEVPTEFYEHLARLGADRAALERVGSRSMMLVPLIARGEPLGVIAIASRQLGRYLDADLALATELAGRAAAAIDNGRLFGELTFRTTVLEAQQEASLDGLLLVSPEGRLLSYNERFAELWGLDRELVTADNETALAEAMRKVADPEAFGDRLRYLYAHPEETGREEVLLRDGRVLDRYGAAVKSADGRYYGWLWSFRDVTEQRRSEEQMAFLAEAGRVIASSLAYELTLERLAALVVPRFADWCSITMREPDGGLRTVAVAHADAERAHRAHELAERHPGDPDSPFGAPNVIRTGEPELVSGSPDELLDAITGGRPELRESARELGPRSSLIVPIAIRDRVLGAIGLIAAESGRTFSEDDLALAQQLGQRVAVAVDNSRLYASLEQSDRRRRFALDSAGIGSWELDLRSGTTQRSLLHDRIFGYPNGAADWTYEIFLRHVDPEHRDVVDALFQIAIEQRGDWDFECRIVRSDGEEAWIWGRGALELDAAGEPTGMAGLVRDISDVKTAEAELERRAQTAQALEFVGDGVFLLDREGVVRLWNPAAEAITGVRAAAAVGKPLTETVSGWTDVEQLVPVAERRRGAGVRAETLPLDVDGHELWVSISGVSFDEGVVYAFRDVTEERAVERLKSDFVSTVSHELRTPLAAIYGAAMTLRRKDVVLAPEQQEGMLGVVAGESERLARIVNDILLASRLDSDVVEVSIGRADPVEIANAVLAAAGAHVPETIELALVRPEELSPIAADGDKVRQVLVNLVENAIKYSPAGGLVTIELEPLGERLRFAVRDEGLGIPASEHDRIFEKFYRLDPNLTRGVGGTGLGLYICQEIVRRLGDRIHVDSDPGRGSTFSFAIPFAG